MKFAKQMADHFGRYVSILAKVEVRKGVFIIVVGDFDNCYLETVKVTVVNRKIQGVRILDTNV